MPNRATESPRDPTPKMAYLALLCALPVWALFAFFGKWERGLGAAVCTSAVFLVVAVRWDLRRHLWFWITIGFSLLLQTPLVLLLPWRVRGSTGISALPICLLSYAIAFGCVKLAEKLTTRTEKASTPS